MDYKEKVIALLNSKELSEEQMKKLEEIFPELKECENWIPKEIIKYLKEKGDFRSCWIAWLEKQDRLMKALQISNSKIGDLIEENYYLRESLEKQGEQKHTSKHKVGDTIYYNSFGKVKSMVVADVVIDSTDNPMYEDKDGNSVFQNDIVEPKFKVGDIITNGKIIGKVDKNENNKYHGWFGYDKNLSVHYADIPDVENWHLWTIQDAKDGSVLCCESGWTCIFKTLNSDNMSFSSYCFMDNTSWFCETGSEAHTLEKAFIKAYNGNIYPATKEQRDILFQKIKEAGYEWNSEKKELKEIEQKYTDNIESSAFKDKLLELFQRFRWYCKDETPTNGDIIDYVDAHIQELIDTVKNEPAEWSEEDEESILEICNYLDRIVREDENNQATQLCVQELKDWLRGIKDRVQPQPKQEWKQENTGDLTDFENAMMHIGDSFFGENAGLDPNDTNAIKEQANFLLELIPKEWSEEDGDIIDNIIRDLKRLSGDMVSPNQTYQKEIQWLKSLRPRSQWKPSDEQMAVLNEVINYAANSELQHWSNFIYTLLKSLREQLKIPSIHVVGQAIISALVLATHQHISPCHHCG